MIEVKNLTKSYPGVIALDKFDFELKNSEMHCIIGENGAGKSTFVGLLTGAIKKDEGEIFIDREKVDINSPLTAMKNGIGAIYQEPNLVDNLTIIEYILLGKEIINNFGLINKKKEYLYINNLFVDLNVDIDITKKIKNLSVSQKQLVELIKLLSLNSKILIFDEPTISLGAEEKETLFKTIERLKTMNKSVIYITHNMDEVEILADRITILRDGKKISTISKSEFSKERAIFLMVGRESAFEIKETSTVETIKTLEIKDLKVNNSKHNINFDLYKGEILGISGLVGSGRTEILETIFGLRRSNAGKILIFGKECKIRNPKDAIKYGIGLVPEDRKEQGMLFNLSIAANITISILNIIAKLGFINSKNEIKIANIYKNSLRIKAESMVELAKNLSGGNQQKVVLSRWLAVNPKILLLDEPTKGIDVATKPEIHQIIMDVARDGVSIIIVSSEVEEILAIADRIIVLKQGEVVEILPRILGSAKKIINLAIFGRAE